MALFCMMLQEIVIIIFDGPRDRVEARTCDVSSMNALMIVISRYLRE